MAEPETPEPDLYAVLGGALHRQRACHARGSALWYDVLVLCVSSAVKRDASDDDVRKAYRTLAQAVHPDKHPSAGNEGGAWW